ncbi:MAG: phosphoribulokinase [Ardenticatenaceae bacterium]|nr:phosphoribulokinase [Ardenticatenaceae bacterium]
MNRKVIMLGIAGDSAAGKTTLSKGIVEALGPDQVTAICCDHYHRYNRVQRKQLGISALSPEGNYIDIMEQHFRLLREGQPILKPVYNHSTGDFDAPEYVRPTKFVIVEGLLPFHTRVMRLCFDVKVYLNPPEDLRHKWKIKRDTTKRGYTAEQVRSSLAGRADLSPRYIQPQRAVADMVVRFQPPAGRAEETGGHLDANLVLRPTIPHPDMMDILQHSGNGTQPAMWLELGRYEGKPVDFLEISGNVTADKARELEEVIQGHLPDGRALDLDRLGRFQSGLVEERSYPLALTQLLIAYHMITAGELVFT